MTHDWNALGSIAPTALADERLQLHYGAWVLGSVAHALLPTRDDDSQTNLGLVASSGPIAFETHALDDDGRARLALGIAALELTFSLDGETFANLPLIGHTVEDALDWAGRCARDAGTLADDAPALSRRDYPDFPASELADGAAFAPGNPDARCELGRWFASAQSALREATADEPGTSAIRTWPHHFDIGALLDLGDGQSIGLGLSPGDHNRDEPYFYAYAYPTPDTDRIPAWQHPVGDWTTTGHTGPLLTATEIVAQPTPGPAAVGFLVEAVAVCRAALATPE